MFAARVRSLSGRLIFSATLLCCAILMLAGVVLSQLNRQAVTNSFDERLRLYLKVLVADIAALTDGTGAEPGNLGEPQFQIPLSGWYWQIMRVDAEKEAANTLRASRSLFNARLSYLIEPVDANRQTDSAEGFLKGPDNRWLRVIEQMIDLGEGNRFYISVAGNAGEIDQDIKRFDTALFITFLFLGAALIASTVVQVKYGLMPLSRLRMEVGAIRRGETDRVGETFPDEVAPLARELNQMIEANREIVDRARMQVGNLAHALKTPISVLINEAEQDRSVLADKLREQTAVMKDQVQYYLDRARAATRAATVGSMTDIDTVMAGFLRTFPKIYRDRNITFEATVTPGLRFRGERQDFEDMVGNLVDNAGKWAMSRVSIGIEAAGQGADGMPRVQIIIDDDGPGLSPEHRKEAVRRGKRLDETRPGSGLGLSIVVDLAGLYHGEFTLDAAPEGGLRARLVLPAV